MRTWRAMTHWHFLLIVFLSFLAGFVLSGSATLFPDLMPDVPNARSSHTKTTPRGGGISFVIPFLLFLVYFLLRFDTPIAQELWALAAGALFVSLLGLADDLFQLQAIYRLPLQLLLTLGVSYFGLPERFFVPGLVEVTGWPALLLNAFWITTFINFFNFMDGLDGIATFQALFATAGAALLLYLEVQGSGQLLPLPGSGTTSLFFVLNALLFSSLVGFLFWNLPPAKLFMGDTGSNFLGYYFGILALLFPQMTGSLSTAPNLSYSRAPYASILDATAVALLLLPFLLDATLTLVRRASEKKNLLQAHREHLYQLLHRNGFSPLKIDGLYFIFNSLVIVPLWLKVETRDPVQVLAVTALIILAGALLHIRGSARLIARLNRK